MPPAPPLAIALAYHGIADVPLSRDPHRLFVHPHQLERHIGWLRRRGYRLVRFAELATAVRAGRASGLAALTFDDGLSDNFDVLLPLLRAHRAPATLYPVTGWLGEPHPSAPEHRCLTGDELRELHAAGLEIGGHTATHPDLSALGFEAARAEWRRCREELEELLGARVRTAAYPFGRVGPDGARACAAAGFEAACRIFGEGSWRDDMQLPRQQMLNRCTTAGLALKRADRWQRFERRRHPVRVARRWRLRALRSLERSA